MSTPSVLPKVISSFSYLSDVGEVRIAPEPDASLRAHAHAVTQISKASLIRNLRARPGSLGVRRVIFHARSSSGARIIKCGGDVVAASEVVQPPSFCLLSGGSVGGVGRLFSNVSIMSLSAVCVSNFGASRARNRYHMCRIMKWNALLVRFAKGGG